MSKDTKTLSSTTDAVMMSMRKLFYVNSMYFYSFLSKLGTVPKTIQKKKAELEWLAAVWQADKQGKWNFHLVILESWKLKNTLQQLSTLNRRFENFYFFCFVLLCLTSFHGSLIHFTRDRVARCLKLELTGRLLWLTNCDDLKCAMHLLITTLTASVT